MSLAKLVEQNGLISYKYHWRFASRPVGMISIGFCPLSDNSLTSFLKIPTFSSGKSAYCLTVTMPGSALDTLK